MPSVGSRSVFPDLKTTFDSVYNVLWHCFALNDAPEKILVVWVQPAPNLCVWTPGFCSNHISTLHYLSTSSKRYEGLFGPCLNPFLVRTHDSTGWKELIPCSWQLSSPKHSAFTPASALSFIILMQFREVPLTSEILLSLFALLSSIEHQLFCPTSLSASAVTTAVVFDKLFLSSLAPWYALSQLANHSPSSFLLFTRDRIYHGHLFNLAVISPWPSSRAYSSVL